MQINSLQNLSLLFLTTVQAVQLPQIPFLNPARHPGQSLQTMTNNDGVKISDVLGRDRSINIFTGLIRDVESAASRLADGTANTTVLAPLNSEMTKLPRKPWEDPEDYSAFGSNAYEGQDGSSRAQRNVQRFVEHHIVPQSPWKEGDKAATVGGKVLWYETKDEKRVVCTET